MSPSISVKPETKDAWDDRKPDDMTHDEFAQYALDCVARDSGEIVDVESIVAQITKQTASEVELAARRGTKSAIEETVIE